MTPQRSEPPGAWIAPVLAGAVLGPALQLQQPALWPVAVYAALLAGALGLAGGLPWTRGWGRLAWCLLIAALAGYGLAGARAATFAAGGLQPSLEGRDLLVTGVVAALPQRNEAGTRFRFRVEEAREGERPVALPPQVLLGWYGGVVAAGERLGELQREPAVLRPGERWQLSVRLKAPHGHLNPHGFDYELWLWEQGVQATGYVRAGPRDPVPRRLGSTWRYPVEQARHATRDAIFERVADPRWAGILAALVVGDQAAIERADWDVFRATGVAHLMSISGLHVTMFAWAAAALVGWVWRRGTRLCLAVPAQHAGLVGGLLLAGGYALFSGWGVPAQRTLWMLAAVTVLRLTGRQWPWPWVWLLAGATVVTVDPWCLLQPGFWLSFVAVGVLFAADRGRAPLAGEKPAGAGRTWRRIAAGAVGLWREQWVVTVALAPLSLLLFSQVSLVGIVANLFAIPWVTLVVTPLGLAGVLLPIAWDLAAHALALLALALEALARVPYATWSAATPPLWAGAAGVLGGLLLAMRGPAHLRLLGVPLLLPVLLWQAPRPPDLAFEVLAADIGQGNAVLVRTATHALLYDAGPAYSRESDAGQRVVVPLLRSLGERVDLVVFSHRDTDHTGGGAAVLAMQGEAGLLSSLEAGHPLQQARSTRRCEAGQAWTWDGVRFEVLHPRAQDYAGRGVPNALSCVLRIEAPGGSALLAGDIEKAQEAVLLRDAGRLRADLLLVPHHGSKTSSTDAWLAAVQPAAALVQAGYRNRFGHPAAEVVARYREHGIPLVESARCGAARWRSWEAPPEVHCERALVARYWHHRMP